MVRSGFTESRHRGAVVALGADGREVLRMGDVARPVFPRSSNKPMQAAGMLRSGLALDGALLALAAGSHSGELFHVAGVREILARSGLSEDALRCPSALPLDEHASHDLLRDGGKADPVHMNCSGKHAAMLATCVAAGWPTDTYLDPAHPLQQRIQRTLEGLCGEEAAAVGVDGCGAPLFAVSLTGLAHAYRAMVTAPPDSAERRVADSMRAHPEWTSGTRRPEGALMAAVPGLLLKSGAEGVQAFALPDGRAAAFKIDDGASRAAPAVAVELLRLLGAATDDGVDAAALAAAAVLPVYGGGRVVGRIRATLRA